MKGKLFLTLALFAFSLLLFSSCKSNSEYADKTLTVKVTAINGGEYTALIGSTEKNDTDFSQKEPPPIPTGEPFVHPTGEPFASPFEHSMPDGMKPPPEGGVQVKPFKGEKTDGTVPPQYAPGMPPDMMPNGTHEPFMGDMPPMMGSDVVFTQGEGTVTFRIDDKTEIIKNGETASVSHITVESILNVTFDSEGKTSKIEILY